MKTNQLMKRDFNGTQITQRTKDAFFNATELLAVYNSNSVKQKKMYHFWENNATKDFINVLENDLISNTRNSVHYNNPIKTYESTRGKGGGTYMHPYLFVKFAMWLSPEFELAIIKWVYDNLIETRNQAGDYFKEMTDAIQTNYLALKGEKPNPFIFMNEANFLNRLCYGSDKGGKRNELTENELSLMNDLQRLNISLINKQVGSKKRKEILTQHSINFKIINN